MPIGTIATNSALAGISAQGNITRESSGQISHEVSLPVAKAGTLSTRTSDTAGTLTLGSDHGITNGQVIDIYWAGGVAYGATVGTVSGTSVPFTAASGDVLPAQGESVTASVEVEIDTDFNGANMEMLIAVFSKRGHIQTLTAADAELDARNMPANEDWKWASGTAVDNPLAGDPVDKMLISNGDATAASMFKIGILYNSVV